MKKILSIAALSMLSLSSLFTAPANAAATSGTFNVDISLTAACKLSTINPLIFQYVALQTGSQPATGGDFTLQCTKGLAIPTLTVGLASGAGAVSVNTTDAIVGLNYTVYAPSAGALPDGNALPYSLTGTMGPNQAGTCASSAAPCSNSGTGSNRAYTLYVAY